MILVFVLTHLHEARTSKTVFEQVKIMKEFAGIFFFFFLIWFLSQYVKKIKAKTVIYINKPLPRSHL